MKVSFWVYCIHEMLLRQVAGELKSMRDQEISRVDTTLYIMSELRRQVSRISYVVLGTVNIGRLTGGMSICSVC